MKSNIFSKQLNNKIMALYRISGIWKNSSGTITHFGFHTVNEKENTVTRVVKIAKENAVKKIENSNNTATTWVWNYKLSHWSIGENVEIVNGANEKYLRSNPDKKETNNLEHLINYDWLMP